MANRIFCCFVLGNTLVGLIHFSPVAVFSGIVVVGFRRIILGRTMNVFWYGAIEQIVEPERRKRLSHQV